MIIIMNRQEKKHRDNAQINVHTHTSEHHITASLATQIIVK